MEGIDGRAPITVSTKACSMLSLPPQPTATKTEAAHQSSGDLDSYATTVQQLEQDGFTVLAQILRTTFLYLSSEPPSTHSEPALAKPSSPRRQKAHADNGPVLQLRTAQRGAWHEVMFEAALNGS